MRTAEVLIVGAGVTGTSIAWHLASNGVRDVVVIDRAEKLAAGSTGRATGGFRTQFGTAVNVQLSLLSREKLLRFEDETGVDPGYRQHGYLFLARTTETLQALRDAQTIQYGCGVAEARMIDASEARALNPAIVDDQLLGGTFCPLDGFLKPTELARGYAEAATRSGVHFEFGVEHHGWRVEGDRVVAAQTSGGEIATNTIVIATGAWAGAPVTPLRRQVAATVKTNVLPESMPMTIWADDGFHLRVRDGRVLLLWPDTPRSKDAFDCTVDDEWLAQIERFRHDRLPCLDDVPIDRDACWAGLYEMTPDRHALLGRTPQFTNVYLATGSSGHGVMHAPAIGQLMSELIRGEATTIDIHSLRPSRFDEGEPIAGSALL